MIRRIEIHNYLCWRYVRRNIGPFQILVGPNGSGKSSFLDAVAIVGDMLRDGPLAAIDRRSSDPRAILWRGEGDRFEIALEMEIPEDRRLRLPNGEHGHVRYEVAIGFQAPGAEISVLGETLWLEPNLGPEAPADEQLELFPVEKPVGEPLVLPDRARTPPGWKKVVAKRGDGNDYFFAERTKWNSPFRLGPKRLALANLPEDEERFPVATWVKRFLKEGIERVALSPEAMRRPCPPGRPAAFSPDGSNFPLVISSLCEQDPERFRRWVDQVRTGLPELQTIETVEREEDRHRYIVFVHETGLRAPSWSVSEGTLRLLALTLIAYLKRDPPRVYLIEEPENGIHPKAIETIYQSLSSAYESQILCASHSPVILNRSEPDQILRFSKTASGVSDVVPGHLHPQLRQWRRGVDLGTLLASGVLG